MTARQQRVLRLALMHWLTKLTPEAYPATAVVEFLEALTQEDVWCKWTNARRELAITALERYGPRAATVTEQRVADALAAMLHDQHEEIRERTLKARRSRFASAEVTP